MHAEDALDCDSLGPQNDGYLYIWIADPMLDQEFDPSSVVKPGAHVGQLKSDSIQICWHCCVFC